jgi:protein-disulfide isomerase
LGIPAGKASAPVKVIVYEDFMCPYCGQFEAAGRGAFAKDIAHGRVQFQYHILNFLDRSSTTDYSTRAANAFAVVMNESGSAVAKRFHDLLFENQPKEGSAGLSDGQLLDLAVRAGADRSAVKPGIDALAFKGWLGNVSDQASKAGVTGTPTVVVDGRTVTWRTTDGLVAKVRAAIDKGR